MKFFSILGVCIVAAALLGMSACEWSTGSEATSWSSNYNWVNFSGNYTNPNGGSLVTSIGSTNAGGTTGTIIYSFNLVQQGQNINITDSDGARYAGYIGELRSASGVNPTNSAMPVDGDVIVATFECSGTSAQGMGVQIVGTLQGYVDATVFNGRTLTGTWIEAGGRTGNINGTTKSVAIAATTASWSDAAAAADTGVGGDTGGGEDTEGTDTY